MSRMNAQKIRLWTPEEDEVLRREYRAVAKAHKVRDLAARIGRTPEAVATRAFVLGLLAVRKPPQVPIYTVNAVDYAWRATHGGMGMPTERGTW